MITRPTVRLSWDDLDTAGCAEHGTPDWDTLIAVGPIKRRDARGRTTLQWTVTVQCAPAEHLRTGALGAAPTGNIPIPSISREAS